jgi:hypothetical protein
MTLTKAKTPEKQQLNKLRITLTRNCLLIDTIVSHQLFNFSKVGVTSLTNVQYFFKNHDASALID